ncbi:MAG: hypothetical protein WCK37_00995 [Candidatus Falkowbacteria bacterium]
MEISTLQFDSLLDAIEKNNISIDDAVSVICGKIIASKIYADKKGFFRLVVDYNLSVNEMIDNCGYCDVSFQPSQSILMKKNIIEVLQARLFIFNANMTSDDVVIFMKDCACHPANFAELLALITILSGDIDSSIIALTTRWGASDNSQVSVFHQRSGERKLCLYDYNTNWSSKRCIFLGIMDTQVPK